MTGDSCIDTNPTGDLTSAKPWCGGWMEGCGAGGADWARSSPLALGACWGTLPLHTFSHVAKAAALESP